MSMVKTENFPPSDLVIVENIDRITRKELDEAQKADRLALYRVSKTVANRYMQLLNLHAKLRVLGLDEEAVTIQEIIAKLDERAGGRRRVNIAMAKVMCQHTLESISYDPHQIRCFKCGLWVDSSKFVE